MTGCRPRPSAPHSLRRTGAHRRRHHGVQARLRDVIDRNGGVTRVAERTGIPQPFPQSDARYRVDATAHHPPPYRQGPRSARDRYRHRVDPVARCRRATSPPGPTSSPRRSGSPASPTPPPSSPPGPSTPGRAPGCSSSARTSSGSAPSSFDGAYNAVSRLAAETAPGAASPTLREPRTGAGAGGEAARGAGHRGMPSTLPPRSAPPPRATGGRSSPATPPTGRGRRGREAAGGHLIHPYDDTDVMAGQGTAAPELFAEAGALDALLAPVGGGGLPSGSALAAAAGPGCRVIGVEPAVADDGGRFPLGRGGHPGRRAQDHRRRAAHPAHRRTEPFRDARPPRRHADGDRGRDPRRPALRPGAPEARHRAQRRGGPGAGPPGPRPRRRPARGCRPLGREPRPHRAPGPPRARSDSARGRTMISRPRPRPRRASPVWSHPPGRPSRDTAGSARRQSLRPHRRLLRRRARPGHRRRRPRLRPPRRPRPPPGPGLRHRPRLPGPRGSPQRGRPRRPPPPARPGPGAGPLRPRRHARLRPRGLHRGHRPQRRLRLPPAAAPTRPPASTRCTGHLKPGGAVTLDLPMPDFSLLGTSPTEEKRAWQGEVDESRRRGAPGRCRAARSPAASTWWTATTWRTRWWLTSRLRCASPSPRGARLAPGEQPGSSMGRPVGDHAGGPVTEGCPRLLARAVRL